MTAKQLHEIALNTGKEEFDSIMNNLKLAAAKGKMSINVEDVSEACQELLRNHGFVVTSKGEPLIGYIYSISFSLG